MKKLILIALLFIFICIVAWKKNNTPKTYIVTLSLDQWEEVLQNLDSTNKVLLGSDVPTKQTVYVSSRLSFLTQTIQMQVSEQLQKEQKADSSNRALKKPK